MASVGKVTDLTKEFHFEWKIDNFFSPSEEDGESYNSPLFSFANESWYMTIFPNSDSEEDSVGWLGIYLFCKRSSPLLNVSWSFSVATHNGKKDHEQQFTYVFCKDDAGYGTPKLLPRFLLLKHKSELVPSDVLTIVFTVEYCSNSKDDADNTMSAKCSHCKEAIVSKCLSSHEQKCLEKPIRCPTCSGVVALKQWFDHVCQTAKLKDDTVAVKCSHCREAFVAECLSSHEQKCLDKPIRCPTCGDVVPLRQWFDHECQTVKVKGGMSLSQDFKKVLLDGKNHDLILKVRDKELRAHQDILRARSQVFESMLNHDMKEKTSGVIDVPDCNPQAMEMFLTYVYSGKVEALDQSNMLGLYYIADKYNMQSLKEDCCDFIKKSLSNTNICDIIQLALNHSDTGLLEYATEYFTDNALDIFITVEWQSLLKDNSTLGNELLIKSFRKVKNIKT